MVEPYIDEKEEASKETYRIGLFLAALVVIGSVFRLYNLNALGLTHDESIQALAVKGILTQGYPALPSGHVYVRALPYLYLEALCVWLLGWGETALRLPSVLFNLALIPLSYFFTRDILDKKTALVAATIVTFSTWEIEFSRVARMYTAFQFFYLLSLYVFFKGFLQKKPTYRFAIFPIFLLTFSLQHLSFPLALLFLFAIRDHAFKKPVLFFYTIIYCALFFLYWYYIDLLFPDKEVFGTLFSSSSSSGIWSSFYTQLHRTISTPSLTFFEQLIRSYYYILLIFLLFLLILIAFFHQFLFLDKKLSQYLIITAILSSCLFHQIGLACLFLLSFILINDYRKTYRITLTLIAIIFMSLSLWIIYAIYDPSWYATEKSFASQLYRILSLLIDYPHLYDKHFRLLFEGWLGFSVWTFLGTIILIFHYIHKKDLYILYIVIGCYIFPLVLISLFGEHVNRPRYFFHLYSSMIVIFSYMSVLFSKWLIKLVNNHMTVGNKYLKSEVLIIVIAILISPIITDDFGVAAPIRISQRTYSRYNTSGLKSLNEYRPYEVDYRTCSLQTKSMIIPDDVVISFGVPVTRYVYTEHIDYFLKQKTASPMGIYTGSIHLSSLDALLEIIERAEGKRVWILGDDCAFVPNWYTADMCDYLQRIEPHAVCRGEDGRAAIYLLNSAE